MHEMRFFENSTIDAKTFSFVTKVLNDGIQTRIMNTSDSHAANVEDVVALLAFFICKDERGDTDPYKQFQGFAPELLSVTYEHCTIYFCS